MNPELLLAAMSILRLLAGKPLTKSDVVAAKKFQDTLTKRVRKIVREGVKPGKLEPKIGIEDLEPFLKDFSDETERLTRMIESEHSEGTVSAALNMWAHLDNIKPKQSVEGTFIPQRPLDIPYSDKAQYLWGLRIADDPLWALDLMEVVQLTATDIRHLTSMYPETYILIVNTFVEEMVAAYSEEDIIERPLRMMLSVLVGEPVVSIATLQAYQEPAQPSTQANIALPEGGV